MTKWCLDRQYHAASYLPQVLPPPPLYVSPASCLRDCFVRTTSSVRITVREEPVHDQADNREDEHADTPEQLVGRWAVRLEDLHCRYISSVPRTNGSYVLQTMMSRIKTMKPMTPPPVPNFQASPWLLVLRVSSAITREIRANWRSMLSAFANILAVLMMMVLEVR